MWTGMTWNIFYTAGETDTKWVEVESSPNKFIFPELPYLSVSVSAGVSGVVDVDANSFHIVIRQYPRVGLKRRGYM